MPKFIDHHPAIANMPPEALQKVQADMKAARADKNGVKGLNAFMSATEQWCLTEAPNAEAVRKTHAEFGVPAGKLEVTEVQALV